MTSWRTCRRNVPRYGGFLNFKVFLNFVSTSVRMSNEGLLIVERFLHVCSILHELLCCFTDFRKVLSLSVSYFASNQCAASHVGSHLQTCCLQLKVQHLSLACLVVEVICEWHGMACGVCSDSGLCSALYQKHLYVCIDNYQGFLFATASLYVCFYNQTLVIAPQHHHPLSCTPSPCLVLACCMTDSAR